MSQLSQEQQRLLKFSAETLSAIDELEKCPEFSSWYLKELTKQSDILANEVLHDELSPEKREHKRVLRLGILKALSLVGEEKNSHERILNGAGFNRGDSLPEMGFQSGD